MKKAQQTAKELAIKVFEWQIRFLPMTKPERDKEVQKQREAMKPKMR